MWSHYTESREECGSQCSTPPFAQEARLCCGRDIEVRPMISIGFVMGATAFLPDEMLTFLFTGSSPRSRPADNCSAAERSRHHICLISLQSPMAEVRVPTSAAEALLCSAGGCLDDKNAHLTTCQFTGIMVILKRRIITRSLVCRSRRPPQPPDKSKRPR